MTNHNMKFEHGTISYLLTSTLTRPATISPTSTCHRKLNVKGSVDIAPIQIPKPHIVSLEAVRKKAKPRIRANRKSTGSRCGKESNAESLEEAHISDGLGPIAPISPPSTEDPPRSPVPSEESSASVTSSNMSSNHAAIGPPTLTEVNSGTHNSCAIALSGKTIFVQTELLQGGCLPGDVLSLKVSIDHNKAVKSMQGLIVTLYRQGRIDTHPAIPLGPSGHGGKRQFEDYYPKSRTGLGGLSLSSAGSSRIFRQDLAQKINPLIIDPQSLTAVLKTSIQVPDHVFPTISCVPGSMISFKYYVEVVIDLRGKLAGQDRFPGLSMINEPQHAYDDPKISRIDGADGVSYSASPGFNYLITDQLRRTKGVVFTATEVIVGTRDSARSRGKQRESIDTSDLGRTSALVEPTVQEQSNHVSTCLDVSGMHPYQQTTSPSATPSVIAGEAKMVPPPEIEEGLDEKAQIRRAEQRLLPSAPPVDSQSSSAPVPRAPPAMNEEDFIHRYALGPPAPAYDGLSSSSSNPLVPAQHLQSHPGMSQNIAGPQDDKQELEIRRLQALASSPNDDEGEADQSLPVRDFQLAPATAPALFEDDVPGTPSAFEPKHSQDDKQELERQRLLAQVSSPDDEAESATRTQHPQPSAPVISEDELLRGHNVNGSSNERLPVYRR